MRRSARNVGLILGLAVLTGCQEAPASATVPAPTTASATTPGAALATSTRATSTTSTVPATESEPDALSIAAMRSQAYPGSDLQIESTLPGGAGYNRYVVSYQSQGLQLLGLLTVPVGAKPSGGWPVILLNHGYIPPPEYSTEESYAGIVAPLAAAGYIVFKPDYRGNGNSPGTPVQPYAAPDDVTDSLNALASIKRYPDANPNRIGVWGHSMGGNVTLHELVVTGDFKAAVIMAGVVGSYSGILNWWSVRVATGVLTTQNDLQTDQLVLQMVQAHGTPQSNPAYWNSIDPTAFTSDIQPPVLIQVGTADQVVPPAFSQSLATQLSSDGKAVTLHTYLGADHNLAPYTAAAMAEAVTFFNQYLK